jgi:hypothetical protein
MKSQGLAYENTYGVDGWKMVNIDKESLIKRGNIYTVEDEDSNRQIHNSLTPPIQRNRLFFIIDNDNHPHPNLSITSVERRAMHPATPALAVVPSNPFDASGDTLTLLHRSHELFLHG